MDGIVSFLEENYVYAVGIGLIIIIMLIGFLSSRRKARKDETAEEKDTMVNINDVNTGEINQVADDMQQNEMKPVDVAAMPNANDAFKVEEQPATPVMEETPPVPQPAVDTPEQPELEPKPAEDVFEKTEVLDFSNVESPLNNNFNNNLNNDVNNEMNNVENNLNSPEPTNDETPFVSDASQYNNDQMLNGEETKPASTDETPKW